MRHVESQSRYRGTPLIWRLSLVLCAAGGPAMGADFQFHYHAGGITASGRLTTADAPDRHGALRVSAISGQRNGVAIQGLWPTGQPIPLNEGYPVDNLLLVRPPHLTVHGLGYALADGSHANPFFADFTQPNSTVEFFSNQSLPGGSQTLESPISFRLTPLSEASPWLGLASIVGILALVAARAPRLGHPG